MSGTAAPLAVRPDIGFRRASELGPERPHEQIPEIAFQALPLGAYDPGLRGRAVYPPPFESVT